MEYERILYGDEAEACGKIWSGIGEFAKRDRINLHIEHEIDNAL